MAEDPGSARDTALDVAEVGAASMALALPPAGLLAIVLGKVERSRARQQAELLRSLSDGLEQVKERVDREYVESDAFEGLVEEVVEKAARRKEMDKRDYYTALLANAALPGRPDEDELAAMVDTLERLRRPHLWLLAALLGTYMWTSEPSAFGGSFQEEFTTLTGADWTSIERDWRVLQQENLVGAIPTGIMTGQGARKFRAT